MPSLSENLSNVKDNLLQRVLNTLLSGFVTTAPPAITATTIAAANSAAAAAATATSIAAAVPAAAPAGGVGAAAGAWDTAANRDAAITTINDLRTHAIEMDQDYEALLADVADIRTKYGVAVTLANELKADFNLLHADMTALRSTVASMSANITA